MFEPRKNTAFYGQSAVHSPVSRPRKYASTDPLTAGVLACKRLRLALAEWGPANRHHHEIVERIRNDVDVVAAAVSHVTTTSTTIYKQNVHMLNELSTRSKKAHTPGSSTGRLGCNFDQLETLIVELLAANEGATGIGPLLRQAAEVAALVEQDIEQHRTAKPMLILPCGRERVVAEEAPKPVYNGCHDSRNINARQGRVGGHNAAPTVPVSFLLERQNTLMGATKATGASTSNSSKQLASAEQKDVVFGSKATETSCLHAGEVDDHYLQQQQQPDSQPMCLWIEPEQHKHQIRQQDFPNFDETDLCHLTLFLRFGGTVRKVECHVAPDVSTIRSMFVRSFHSIEDVEACELCIEHPKHRRLYTLEDMGDVCDGSLLELVTNSSSHPNATLSHTTLISEPPSNDSALMLTDIHRRIQSVFDLVQKGSMRQSCSMDLARQDLLHNRSCTLDDSNAGAVELQSHSDKNCYNHPDILDCISTYRRDLREIRQSQKDASDFFFGSMRLLQTNLRSALENLKSIAASQQTPNRRNSAESDSLRSKADSQFETIDRQSETLEHRATSLRVALEILRVDTTRGSQLKNGDLSNIRKQIDALKLGAESFSGALGKTKDLCKPLWASELQRIVDEQAWIKEHEFFGSSMKIELNEFVELLEAIGNIVQLRELPESRQTRAKENYPPRRLRINQECDPQYESAYGQDAPMRLKDTLLSELRSKVKTDASSEQRLAALGKIALAQTVLRPAGRFISPFSIELSDYVSKKMLEAAPVSLMQLDAQRQKRDQMLAALLYNQHHKSFASSGGNVPR